MKRIIIVFVLVILSVVFIGCESYSTSYNSLNNKPPRVSIGESNHTITLFVGDEFQVPEVICMDENPETCRIEVSHNVDTTTDGEYTVTYTAIDNQGETDVATSKVFVFYRTYTDKLISENKTISLDDLEYMESTNNINYDYSDDSRELIDVSGASYYDVIEIQDPAFERLIRLELGYDENQEITFGALQTITFLRASDYDIYDIESIAGIEYLFRLERLSLSNNLKLTSINGIQSLYNLKVLDLSHTSIKKIDYNMDSLEKIKAEDTKITFQSENELMDVIRHWPRILEVFFGDNDFMINPSANGPIHSYFKDPSRSIYLNFLQIDMHNIPVSDLIDYHIYGIFVYMMNDYFVEGRNTDFVSDYYEGLDLIYDYIGIEDGMNEIAKIILIYDFLLDNYQVDPDTISEIYDYPYPWSDIENYITLDKVFAFNQEVDMIIIPYLFRILLQKAGIHGFEGGFAFGAMSDFDAYTDAIENGGDEEQYIIYDRYDGLITVKLENGERYFIDIFYPFVMRKNGQNADYERFLVGGNTLVNSIKIELYGTINLSEEQWFRYSSGIELLYNFGDVSRTSIIENLPEGISVE
ncbi:immunoglobulin-like domain-containing protein [Candidatus Izemoplasma sp. B36]|uniref:immunoglobulin-like domain-containing protein n=1 Tax=Candidatus Izemoplasma sp. B36 TaxID=3242468 RepID=UPI0035585F0A